MRKAALLALGLGGLALAGAAVIYERRAPPPQPVAVAQNANAAAPPEAPPLASKSVPPVPEPAQQPAPPPVPASAAVPDLPTVDIKPRPIYVVPNEEPPIPKVTLYDRNGKEIATRQASLAPYSPPAAPPPLPPPVAFGGAAQAAGGTTLAVAGKAVRLYGVRLADPRDRCGLGAGDARNCSDVARDALAQRLRRYPSVSCQTPPGQRGDPAAICIDASGTDLGGFLVAEGYALADTNQSYEYFGSEGVARYYRRGLWRNR